MQLKLFAHPTDEQIENAYVDGLRARPARSNPYVVDGDWSLSNLLAWAWDFGRRETQFLEEPARPRAFLGMFGGGV